MDLGSRRNKEITSKRSKTVLKPIYVTFFNQKIEKEFAKLAKGKNDEIQLHKLMQKAINSIKENPSCAIKIPRKLWPPIYLKIYNITNLWKYDLPHGWRLMYTIKEDNIVIISIILEWFDHKSYEKRFKY